MAIEKKSLIDTRASAKKAVVASKAAASKPHTVVAPRNQRPLKAARFQLKKASPVFGHRA